MPNAGISFMVQARLVPAFQGLRPGRAEHGVKYLLMGTRQVVETHSHLVIWPGAISYAIVCTSKSANCTTAPPMGMLCVLVWVVSVSCELCECVSLALSVRIAIVSGVSKWSSLLLLYIPDGIEGYCNIVSEDNAHMYISGRRVRLSFRYIYSWTIINRRGSVTNLVCLFVWTARSQWLLEIAQSIFVYTCFVIASRYTRYFNLATPFSASTNWKKTE